MNLVLVHGFLNRGTFLRPLQRQKVAGDILEKLHDLGVASTTDRDRL
jgi:hypothetical protein